MQKYDYSPNSSAIFVEVVERSNHSVGKPEFFMVDNVDKEELADMFNELRANREEMSMQNYRGCDIKIIDNAPDGFLEKKLKSAIAEMEHVAQKIEWLKNAIEEKK